jgi:hypothetical protein
MELGERLNGIHLKERSDVLAPKERCAFRLLGNVEMNILTSDL